MELLFVLAVGLLPVGVISLWAGAGMLREQWVLRHRGVRVPAVAERWVSRAGSFGVYRFVDTGGRPRLTNAERVRSVPAAEVEIVYDPRNIALVKERSGFLEVVLGVVCLATGIVVTASALVGVGVSVVVLV
jgi:hypothetical protein